LFDFSRSKDETKQKLKEITSMRMQLDRNLEELNEYRRKLDLSARDNKRLQDDLLTVTRENQVKHLILNQSSILTFDFLDNSSRTRKCN
jgi:hypothetical protein